MAVSIQSTTRPFGLDNNTTNNTGSNNISSGINNTTNVGSGGTIQGSGIATSALKSSSTRKVPNKNINMPLQNFDSSTRQQAINANTINSDKPEVVYENRYLNKQDSTSPSINTNNNLTNTDRSNLSILNNWVSKLKASNQASNVTTYSEDASTVPLLRRDVSGYFQVDYNEDGSFNLSTTGLKIPFTDTTVGKYNLINNMSWNPIHAYNVAMPIGNYLVNYQYYDTKNQLIQGTRALSAAYSNFYNGEKNFVDDYAIKEWGNLVDMTANWSNRTAMQNTFAGLNTVTGLSQRYGFNDYLGGDNVVGGVQNILALYTFGNSVYQLGKQWNGMSTAEKTMATLNTIQAGNQAYGTLKPYMTNLYKSLGEEVSKSAANASITNTTASVGKVAASNSAAYSTTNTGLKAIASQDGGIKLTNGAIVKPVGDAASGNTMLSNGMEMTKDGSIVSVKYNTGKAVASGAGGSAGGGAAGGAGGSAAASSEPPVDMLFRSNTETKPFVVGSENYEHVPSPADNVAAKEAWKNAGNGLAGATAAFGYAKGMGKSDRTAAGWGAAGGLAGYFGGPWCAAGVLAVQSIENFCNNGRTTAKDRQAGAMNGAVAGATVGACFGLVGAGVGAIVGAVVGVAANSGHFGHSREQWKRGLYRDSLAQFGIFDKKGKGDPNHGHFFYQLADGQEYNVGIDGHAGRATDINGNTKTVYDQSQILDRDWNNSEKVNHEIRPYDVDYTCNMDYTGSLMLAPLNCLGLGGSNVKEQGEYGQMLGYMTNACTSNVGRDMTRNNWDKMVANIKAGYERVGITDRQTAQNAIALSYMQGNITDEDWDSFQLALNLLYSDNGYDQAMYLMDQLGRTQQQTPLEINTSQEEQPEEMVVNTDSTAQVPYESGRIRQPAEMTTTSGSATLSQEGATDTTPQIMTESDIAETKGNEQITNPGEQ